jgi:hypothetical protein
MDRETERGRGIREDTKTESERKTERIRWCGSAEICKTAHRYPIREETAKSIGTSHDTLHKAKTIAKEKPELLKDVDLGKRSIHSAYNQTKFLTLELLFQPFLLAPTTSLLQSRVLSTFLLSYLSICIR